MKLLKFSVLSLLMVSVFVTGAWAADWVKKTESDGFIGYTRATTKTSIDEMKGWGVINAPIAVVEAVLRDIPAEKDFMFMCGDAAEINTPELKGSADVKYVYNVTDLPFPVNDRDVVAKALYTIDKASGTVYVHVTRIESPYKLEKKLVRMPIADISYTLVPKGPDKTEVTYEALADPGGNLPAPIINMLGKYLGVKTVVGIQDLTKKDKYKNAKAVVTTTPHS